jgi:16S rRNA (guanine527-N7)-methyltransferase
MFCPEPAAGFPLKPCPDGSAELGERERRLLDRFLDLVYAEGDRLNLTRVPRAEARRRHIQESLDLIPLRNWSPGERVFDLGSGGGFPGIPLAIVVPAISMTLIERDRAKGAFLLSTLGQLGLGAVEVAVGEARELAASPGFQPAQVLVSRAAMPASRLLRLAGALLAPGGEAMLHVGKSVAIDAELVQGTTRAGLEGLSLQHCGASRVLRFRRGP